MYITSAIIILLIWKQNIADFPHIMKNLPPTTKNMIHQTTYMVSGERIFEIPLRFLGHFYNHASNDVFFFYSKFENQEAWYWQPPLEKIVLLTLLSFLINECSMNFVIVQGIVMKASRKLYEGFTVKLHLIFVYKSASDKVYTFVKVSVFT